MASIIRPDTEHDRARRADALRDFNAYQTRRRERKQLAKSLCLAAIAIAIVLVMSVARG